MKFQKSKIVSAILVMSLLLNTTEISVLAESNNSGTKRNAEISIIDDIESEEERSEYEIESDFPEETITETAEIAVTDTKEITIENDSPEETATETVTTNIEETTTESDFTEESSTKSDSTEEITTETVSTEETTIEIDSIEEFTSQTVSDEEETKETATESAVTEETAEETVSSEIETETATETTEEATTEELTTEESTTEELTEESTTELATDVLFPGLPENYSFSSRQLKDKSILAAYADDIFELEEESDSSEVYVKGEVVYLTDSEEDALTVAEGFGGTLESFGDGVAVIRLGEGRTVGQAVRAAASKSYHLPAVWPNYYYQLFEEYNDPALKENSENYQWAHEYIGDQYAWEKGYKGNGVKIGIIDTGVHSTHEDLQENVTQNLTMVPEGGVATTIDPDGHGTHVAGIAAAVGNNGKGGAGIAPDAQIYAYSVMDSDGHMLDEYILRAINRAVDDGVEVINMSLGSGYYNGNEESVIEKAYQNGVAVFAAAGNEATNGYEFPASYDNVCSIAAIMQDGSKAGFTNYGDKIDLAFPGVEIYSTVNDSNQAYDFLQGTSMACPVAAGTAAVILSASDEIDALKGKRGAEKVEALFSVMKKNAVKSSSPKIGAGTTYLPNVLGIKIAAIDEAPQVPVIKNIGSTTTFTKEWEDISIECNSPNTEIYYSINGKKPTFKNGIVTNGELLTEGKAHVGGAKQVTLSVIAVNRITGKASKVVSQKFYFEPGPSSVIITAADSVDKIAKGKSLTLSAVVEPSYAKFGNGKVTWEVANNYSGVKVNSNGKVTVDKNAPAGECTIRAKAGSVQDEFTLTILDAVKIKKVAFSTKKFTVYTEDLINILKKEDGSSNLTVDGGEITDIVWSSNNKKVAVVDTNGTVTALAPGKAVIKATANDGSKKAASCTITVKQLAESITLKGPEKIAAGKSAVIQVSILPANVSSKKLDWTVNSVGGASGTVTVNASGKVSVKKGASGKFEVVATEKGVPEGREPKTASIQFEAVTTPITKIEIPKTVNLFTVSGNYNAPRQFQLLPEVEGGDDKALQFISSAPGIASVDSGGLIVAHSSGKATITCSATDGSNKKAKCNVVVSVPMSRIAIVPKNGNEGIVSVGSKITFSAKISNNFGKAANQKVKWSIMHGGEQYAEIDENKGIVKGTASVIVSNYYPQIYVKAEAVDGSGASAVYPVVVIPKVNKLNLEFGGFTNQVDSKGIYYSLSMSLKDYQGKSSVPSYNVEISGGKGIGYHSIKGGFILVPTKPTTNKTYSQLVVSENRVRCMASDIQSVTVTVTLKDGSNKKAVHKFDLIYTKDQQIILLK